MLEKVDLIFPNLSHLKYEYIKSKVFVHAPSVVNGKRQAQTNQLSFVDVSFKMGHLTACVYLLLSTDKRPNLDVSPYFFLCLN